MVGCAIRSPSAGMLWDISVLGLPERMVIWELMVRTVSPTAGGVQVSLALGDQNPANAAEFIAMEHLFNDVGEVLGTFRSIRVNAYRPFIVSRLRMGVETAGRRLVMQSVWALTNEIYTTTTLVVSAIPRSIPDWYRL